jgi:hypothetical protein
MTKLENILILDMTTKCYLNMIEYVAGKGVIVKDAYVAATVLALM